MSNLLNTRARDLFRQLVDTYLETGDPVGSRTLAQLSHLGLSPASIRSILADLETEGLLYAPHVSAGRLPTQKGLRLYVDGLMEVGNLTPEEQGAIMAECQCRNLNTADILERASTTLSGLAAGIGMVVAPKTDKLIKQIHLIRLEPGKALVVLVGDDGVPENRLVNVDPTLPDHVWDRANNILRHVVADGRSLDQARADMQRTMAKDRETLDQLTRNLVEAGLAVGDANIQPAGMIIVRGQSRLLQDVRAMTELEHARDLLAKLEEQDVMLGLLDAVHHGEGVQIFIGTEHQIFNNAGWSMVISPYRNGENRIIGALGVIGPSRLNYGRIVPIVDYTSQVVSRLIGGKTVS